MIKSKTYHIYKQKRINNTKKYCLQDKIKIECIGGDSMTEEKELVFLNPEDIPRLTKGASKRNWTELFDKIPVGKMLLMDSETYGSPANIRTQVKAYNEEKKATLKVTQRTDKKTETVNVYVINVKK